MKAVTTVLAATALLACNTNSDYILNVGLLPDSVIRLELSTHEAPADGAEEITLTARIPASADVDKRTITFSSTAGTIKQGSNGVREMTADAAGVARVVLVAPLDTGIAIVRASIENVIRQDTIHFITAFADTVLLDLGGLSIAASAFDEVILTATLQRASGTPSPGAEVRFTATDASGNPKGRVRNVTVSNAEGRVTALYALRDSLYTGTLTFRAAAAIAVDSARGELEVEVVQAAPPRGH